MSAGGTQVMAGIEPHSVLEQLDPLLGQTGCIKSAKEVGKIVSLMKAAQLLVVRIVILNIIKATRAPSTLERFMEAGWPVLNVWLAEAKKTQNIAVLVEVMQVLLKLPVSVAALKQGNMGKLIKQLSKQEHPEVKDLATDLLSKWMAIFKEGQAASKSKPASSAPDIPSKEKDKVPLAPKHQDDAPSTPTKTEKEKKEKPSKKKEKSKGAPVLPPVEAKPPPGPLVALGRRDKPLKRPRDFPLKGQPPAEKRNRQLLNSDDKSKGKGPVESEGFINALSSQAAKMKEKKRKVSKPKALSLLSKSGAGGEGDRGTPTPTSAEPPEPMDTTENSETPGDENRKRKKKSVSWVNDDNLVTMHYFEMDDSERAMTRNRGSFMDAAQREKMREREALESGLMFSRDRLIEMIAWQRPQRNESLLELVDRGVNSEQRKMQAEREEKVLAQLFLSKSSLHPSPSEPDPEHDVGKSEPKHIPLMEPSTDSQQQSSPMFSSPPHLGGPPHITPGSPLQSPATTIHQAQSLINFYNEGRNPQMPHPTQPDPHPLATPQDQQTPNPFHLPPGPPPIPPHFHNNGPGMMPPGSEFYNNYNQQGFPPGPAPIHNPDWNGPAPSGYYGGGGPPIRRGMRGGYRGRGRGFVPHGFSNGPHAEAFSKICKHFVTHGCRLGNKCRFLHCTPSELAEKLTVQKDSLSKPQQKVASHDTSVTSDTTQMAPATQNENQS